MRAVLAIIMGRVKLHLHGKPRHPFEPAIMEYSKRVEQRGVTIETHSDKMSCDDYLARILKGAGGSVLILLDEGGVECDSKKFAELFNEWRLCERDVHLVIGPAEGFGDCRNTNGLSSISLSKMTMPHEFAATFLLEQLYRATEILKGSRYHK